ncbi:hypothetical protein H8K47_17300 [Undibacterium sp. CY7W]|uniref:Uncharacterized protein n=1 Tax=Undibacterium rugosum TaxID=2762291 RepID=A0A923L0M2_9BURK|nr:hypothetical protein [Undibacterium rugosum]MBC3937116.1 hypothetical protein [Undibacterium rugosum]
MKIPLLFTVIAVFALPALSLPSSAQAQQQTGQCSYVMGTPEAGANWQLSQGRALIQRDGSRITASLLTGAEDNAAPANYFIGTVSSSHVQGVLKDAQQSLIATALIGKYRRQATRGTAVTAAQNELQNEVNNEVQESLTASNGQSFFSLACAGPQGQLSQFR